MSNNEDNDSTIIAEAHSPPGSLYSNSPNSTEINIDPDQYQNPYAKIDSQMSSFQVNVTTDNRRWEILYRPTKELLLHPFCRPL